MAQIESIRDLQPGKEFINGCAGIIRYTRESEGPFQGRFKRIQLNCQRCGIVSAMLEEPLLPGMNVLLSEEKMPQSTEQFLNSFCGVSKGIIWPRRRDTLSTESKVETTQNSILLEKLGLTPRPGEVLTRTLEGQSPVEIHHGMNIKLGTVYLYLHRIREALAVQTTPQAVAKAIQLSFEVNDPKDDKLESQ